MLRSNQLFFRGGEALWLWRSVLVGTNLRAMVYRSSPVILGRTFSGSRVMLMPPAWLLVWMYFSTCWMPLAT